MEDRKLVLARRFAQAMFVLMTLTLLAWVVVSVVKWSPWDLGGSLICLSAAGILWEPFFAARAGRPSRWAWRAGRIVLAERLPGRRFRGIDELRAEYAQGILEDASRDAILSAVLDDLAANFFLNKGEVRSPDDLVSLTSYANEYVDSLSDPGHTPLKPIYQGYSTDLLVVAAACRAADRMRRR